MLTRSRASSSLSNQNSRMLTGESWSLETQNRISVKKQPESSPNSEIPCDSAHLQLSSRNKRLYLDTDAEECADVALSSWNEQSLSEQGPEYVLVEALHCKQIAGPIIYHCNFIARPKNGSEAENKLFFAELKNGRTGALACSVCCILGPSDTGSIGCDICKLHPICIHHPKNVEFTKGREDARLKYVAEKQLESGKKPRKSYPAPAPPRVQLCMDPNSVSWPKEVILKHADLAISSWNEKSLHEQGPEYEVVDSGGINMLTAPFIYHLNFIARPKNETKAKSKLFFAETMYIHDLNRMGCTVCCILGARGTETGLCGCGFCVKRPVVVQHPQNGKFVKNRIQYRRLRKRGYILE